jgi:hypothetical protein
MPSIMRTRRLKEFMKWEPYSYGIMCCLEDYGNITAKKYATFVVLLTENQQHDEYAKPTFKFGLVMINNETLE